MNNWQDALSALKSELPVDNTPIKDESEAGQETTVPLPVLVVQMERRRGKPATIVSGFDPETDQAENIAARLKKTLATGGSARGGEILIQGDRRTDVGRLLRGMGYKVRGEV